MPYIENSENPIVDLSYNFGVRIVRLYKKPYNVQPIFTLLHYLIF